MKVIMCNIVAMNKPTRRLHLEIQRHRASVYGLIRSTFREDGKIKHTTHGRLTGLSEQDLRLIQAAFRGGVIPKASPEAYQAKQSKEYGACAAVLETAKALGLDKLIYSKPSQPWVHDCLAMIAGRVVYAGSKLGLSNRWQDTALWELMGVEGRVDVEKHCYAPMDRLLERQGAIQKGLAGKHLGEGALVLYDITSSYVEGAYEGSLLVDFGYNRDGKRGHEQVVIGLLCSGEGCPVGVEVFAGNTQDAATMLPKIEEIQQRYGIEDVIVVGDRGMITRAKAETIKDRKGVETITALTHREVVDLVRRNVIQMSFFDAKEIVEIVDPEQPLVRYCLCSNPATATKETSTRTALLEVTRKKLEAIATAKRRASKETIGSRVGRVLEKTKMGKFVQWLVEDGRLKWTFKEEAITKEECLDGCYIIKTDVPRERMAKQEVVASYKKLAFVEQAFRCLKTVQLEIRPIYHKTDDRIRCHVFVCMLAYYLQWHMKRKLKRLFQGDGKGSRRAWTFEQVMERLKSVRREMVHVGGTSFKMVTPLDEEQQRIISLLGISL